MYTLYTIPGSCSTGITVLMEKLGVEYNLVKRDDVPNYNEIVPTNQVPAIKTENGNIITEGAAIAMYLLDKHGKELLPENIDERANFYQWLNFDYSTLHPAYGKLFSIVGNTDISDEIKSEVMQYFADTLSQLWNILDKHLLGRKYILGDTPCHVDYMATVYSSWNHYFPDTKIILGDNLKRFINDVSALPEFKAGYLAENIEFAVAA